MATEIHASREIVELALLTYVDGIDPHNTYCTRSAEYRKQIDKICTFHGISDAEFAEIICGRGYKI